MKAVYASLGFALTATAALIPRDQCCFSLTASGGESGVLGQLADGQNRIGQTSGLATQSATYCINNGGLTDGSGRGCILTPPTTQFQCDTGATPTTGFSVNGAGMLTYMSGTQFYACATGDEGGYNVYTNVTSKQTGCVPITLSTGGKCIGGVSSSAPAASAPASSRPASSAPASSAPASSSRPPSSAPASSAPASSRPASSAPASSAPVSSGPASTAGNVGTSAPVTRTVYSTSYVTVSNCVSTVTTCPAVNTLTLGGNTATVTGGIPSSVPISSAPSAATTYACNPAHSYPGGVTCVSSGTGLTLITPSATTTLGTPYPTVSSTASVVVNTVVSVGSGTTATSLTTVRPSSGLPSGVTLVTTQGGPAASASGSIATTVVTSAATGSVCQTTLTGAYQTPHAIIPVNKNMPNKAYGTQYNATISPSESTIFNFDIPASYAGKQCTAIFLFPMQSQLVTSSFTESGAGGLEFSLLKSPAPLGVTYASQPAPAKVLSTLASAHPGMSYVVSTGPCIPGTESIEVSSVGGYSLEFFEDYNPAAIGLYITSC